MSIFFIHDYLSWNLGQNLRSETFTEGHVPPKGTEYVTKYTWASPELFWVHICYPSITDKIVYEKIWIDIGVVYHGFVSKIGVWLQISGGTFFDQKKWIVQKPRPGHSRTPYGYLVFIHPLMIKWWRTRFLCVNFFLFMIICLKIWTKKTWQEKTWKATALDACFSSRILLF